MGYKMLEFFGLISLMGLCVSSCSNSIEELSLSSYHLSSHAPLTLTRSNMYELCKLKRLTLFAVTVDDTFFTDFGARFPCLNELNMFSCRGPDDKRFSFHKTWIVSTSLRCVDLEFSRSCEVAFDVPNIRRFKLTCLSCLPPDFFRIQTTAGSEWEFVLSIVFYPNNPHRTEDYLNEWFLSLKNILEKSGSSRMSLYFPNHLRTNIRVTNSTEPLVLENLKIDAPRSCRCRMLACLFDICRPKFITLPWRAPSQKEEAGILVDRLHREGEFARFGVKVVKMEYYEKFRTESRPFVKKEYYEKFRTGLLPFSLEDGPMDPANEQRVRLELKWGEVEEALC